jgi:hypothetical protein
MTQDPVTKSPWTKGKFGSWRSWIVSSVNPINASQPGGLFIHSITETVGFQFNGAACPVLPSQ